MSRTPIQVSFELKDQLEDLKSSLHVKSLPDVIERLIQLSKQYTEYRQEKVQEKQDEGKRREREDVYLGEEMKQEFTKFQESIGLRSPAQVIEFLIANFDSNLTMSRIAFDTYVRLKQQ